MSPIKDFRVIYVPLHKMNTFSAGDIIEGKVTFTLTEDTKIKCLYVKAKGDARVHWSESHGTGKNRRRRSYTAHKRYYKAKQILVTEVKDGTVLPRGDHSYKFKLKIPEGNIPPSFKGFYGKIVHLLQAKMSRSWHISSSDQRELNFVSRTFYLPSVQSSQAGSIDKKVGTFSKGQVHLSGSVNRRICSPGETLTVAAKITNRSSKKMRIKFSIEQRSVYRAQCRAKIGTGTVCKLVGQTIEPGFEGDVTCPVTVPVDTALSIYNCEIINVEFYLKVYLDISFALDPEVVLPLIIVAPGAMVQQGHHGFPNTPGAVGGPSSSDFPPPFCGPYPAPGPSNANHYPPPGPYPNMPVGGFYNPVPGYNSQMPQQPVPYGYPAAPFMAYPVQPQANTTNAQFPQDMTPPAYGALYPPVPSGKDMDKKTQL